METEIEHPEELLPWYVNDTLTDEERSGLEEHLKGCEQCRKEVEYLKALRSQVKATSDLSPYGELGLKRLLSDIKKEAQTPRRFAFQRWQPALAIAASLIIILQSLILYNYWQQSKAITPLSGPVHKGVVLQVSFAPDASEAQIRKVLQSVEGSIIDGPGAIGIYRVRLNLTTEDEERIGESIAILKSHSDVVIHVARK
jgi:anti-sigma factor RsiW